MNDPEDITIDHVQDEDQVVAPVASDKQIDTSETATTSFDKQHHHEDETLPPSHNKANNSTLQRISTAFDQALRSFFFHLGYTVASYPGRTIALAVFVALTCGAGVIKFHTEDDAEVLWAPQNSLAVEHDETINMYFDSPGQIGIIFTSKSGKDDIATQLGLLQMITVLEAVNQVEIQDNGEVISFDDDVCIHSLQGGLGLCSGTSVLDLFWDEQYMTSPTSFLATVKAKIKTLNDEQVKQILSTPSYYSWNGNPISSDRYISIDDSSNSDILEALAFRIEYGIYDLEQAETVENEIERVLLNEPIEGTESLEWYLATMAIFVNAVDETLTSDIDLLAIGIVLAVVYVCSMLGLAGHPIKSRVGLGLLAILSILLAIIASVGIGSLISFYGPVHQVLPLLMVAVGVDDTFVIVAAFDELDDDMDVKERVARALSRAGASITVTTLTNSCAFFIGSLTETLALKYFAYWAGIGILFDFVFQSTFFIACLTYDAQRQQQKKRDVVCCKKSSNTSTRSMFGITEGLLEGFFESTYSPHIMNTFSVAFVVMLTLASFGFCVYGTTLLKNEFDLAYFFMDGTRAKEFDDAENKYFGSRPTISCILFTGDFNYADTTNQQKMTRLFDIEDGYVAQNQYYLNNSLESWYNRFREFGGLTSIDQTFPSEDYYTRLEEFLSSDVGTQFQEDLVFDDAGKLVATRSMSLFVTLVSNAEEVDAMLTMRSSVDEADLDEAFPFNAEFIYYEGDAVIKDETIKSMLISLAGVFVVTFVLIGNARVASIVLLGVCFSVVDLLGLMHFLDINLNTVSVITLALAIGLTIDFSAHIGLLFVTSVGSKKERVTRALSHLGPALTHSGFTTVIAISILAGARSYVFQVLFKMFVLIILLGMFHGMLVVPVVLYLAGPESMFASNSDAIKIEDVRMKELDKKSQISGN
mmetsp:Transcript_22970/g.34468  ORF Transcript_22970/g.34468 Transcript_22970/m.34468 type:complete len:929 (-) Transcript_22970:474-3260(-)|eukprot:CAMPEP_0116024020 /NCGR_PEP_ID=MMETSP0321-20121206/12033_1 /TAXON_ID=163516 /ORGANISM="Leptocylindrus danicus var. danicus, Strain B650" /LENGTH=928 /DNA_ID=CAMNT_0003495601 /DNA_START=425 /DNA_END=3211 /DNA_ORIENTATION=-